MGEPEFDQGRRPPCRPGTVDRRSAVAQLATLTVSLAPLAGCAPFFGGSGSGFSVDRSRIPDGSVLVVRHHDLPVLVLNVGGTVKAFSGLCTHEGCELGWNARQQLIRCPCHASAFDTSGQVKAGPAPRSLPEFPTRIKGQKVIVTIPT